MRQEIYDFRCRTYAEQKGTPVNSRGPFLSEVSPTAAVLAQADIGRERTSSDSEREGEKDGDKGLS